MFSSFHCRPEAEHRLLHNIFQKELIDAGNNPNNPDKKKQQDTPEQKLKDATEKQNKPEKKPENPDVNQSAIERGKEWMKKGDEKMKQLTKQIAESMKKNDEVAKKARLDRTDDIAGAAKDSTVIGLFTPDAKAERGGTVPNQQVVNVEKKPEQKAENLVADTSKSTEDQTKVAKANEKKEDVIKKESVEKKAA